MHTKLATSLIIGALLFPVAGIAAEKAAEKAVEKAAAPSAKETPPDPTIPTRIKAEFAKDKAIEALNLSVEMDAKGVVTLSGTAKTVALADKAVDLAHATKGVNLVKNNIKVSAKK